MPTETPNQKNPNQIPKNDPREPQRNPQQSNDIPEQRNPQGPKDQRPKQGEGDMGQNEPR